MRVTRDLRNFLKVLRVALKVTWAFLRVGFDFLLKVLWRIWIWICFESHQWVLDGTMDSISDCQFGLRGGNRYGIGWWIDNSNSQHLHDTFNLSVSSLHFPNICFSTLSNKLPEQNSFRFTRYSWNSHDILWKCWRNRNWWFEGVLKMSEGFVDSCSFFI